MSMEARPRLKPITEVVEPRRPTAVERTRAAIRQQWAGDTARQSQAHAFIKRATKSDRKRRQEKASRKRNRRK